MHWLGLLLTSVFGVGLFQLSRSYAEQSGGRAWVVPLVAGVLLGGAACEALRREGMDAPGLPMLIWGGASAAGVLMGLRDHHPPRPPGNTRT